MTKYTEFIQKRGSFGFFNEEQLKIELDEVIIEKLHAFVDYYNKSHRVQDEISNGELLVFLQNKEE